jgi:hypothetical protein
MNFSKESPYQNYLKSGIWKCNKSPSGAHRWIENRSLKDDGDTFTCAYCGVDKQFSDWSKSRYTGNRV